ncbi:MAG TPA: hypothetical protein VK858_04400 [Longimicrobiales bacterium]|nr:hypothetical protein [Longimicrobiales bacterium]
MIRRFHIAAAAALTATAACSDQPVAPDRTDLTAPEVAAATAMGSDNGRGQHFVSGTAVGFRITGPDGVCRGTYTSVGEPGDFIRIDADGNVFRHKQTSVDPLEIRLASGEVLTGTGRVSLNGSSPNFSWTASGQVTDSRGQRHTAVCTWRSNRNDASTEIRINGGHGKQGNGRSELIATLEWPFPTLQRTNVPSEAQIFAYYNGFYNPPPCTNAETTLEVVSLAWNSGGVVHRYDASGDPSFDGFADCLTDGLDQTVAVGVEGVTAWAVSESFALDFGSPDLVGRTIDYIELVVEEMSTVPNGSGFEVTVRMRWDVYGR